MIKTYHIWITMK